MKNIYALPATGFTLPDAVSALVAPRMIAYFVRCAIWTFATIAIIASMQAGVFPGNAEAVDAARSASHAFLPQLVQGICLVLAVLDQMVAMFTERRQSLGDLLAGTVVVDRERARTA